MYNTYWGEKSRDHNVQGTHYREILVVDHEVQSIYEGETHQGPIRTEGFILSGKGEAAQYLSQLEVGDEVTVSYAMTPDFEQLQFAVGGSVPLVTEGKIATADHGARHPRTAIGFSQDGSHMYLATIDGRQRNSRGMTLLELAHFMHENGAYHALNLDGGGSSTLVARALGRDDIDVYNSPSDGGERPVPNGIGIWNEGQSGELAGFHIDAYTQRVFQGLSRDFEAYAYDSMYAPMEINDDDIKWHGGQAGHFEGNTFVAKQPGQHDISARYKNKRSHLNIHVLGEPVSLHIEPQQIGLEKGQSSSFLVTAKDEEGYKTYIEPRDMVLSYDESIVNIEANEDGSLTAEALVDSGATLVKAQVGDLEAYLGLTVGLEKKVIETFEDTSQPWTFFKYPAQVDGSLAYVNTKEHGQSVRLNYDFTTTTRTRAAYMFPPNTSLPLDGDVKTVGVDVYGSEGNGHWLRARIRDNSQVYHVLDLHYTVDWDGWRYVEANIPPGVEYPITLDRIYLVETDPNKQDTGYIMIDNVQTKVSQTLNIPDQQYEQTDPLILQNESVSDEHWTFAVLTDLHLVSGNPHSKETRHAIKTLQALNEQDHDFVIFNGDVIDYDTEEEYEYAKQLIDSHLDLPYYVTPGNHEVYGTNNLDNFEQYFGPDHDYFDHHGTRFLLLNTSMGSLSSSNVQQWFTIKEALEEAKDDETIKNIVVLGHHPLRDPLPDGARGLSDGKEATLLEQWLTAFREETGKGVLMASGHAHLVDLERRDGIPYMVTGPNGKGAYGSPDHGGFYNYTVFSVDPEWKVDKRLHSPAYQGLNKKPWIRAEVRPILEDITLSQSTFTTGTTTPITFTGHQAADWRFPLRYPATVYYEGSERLFIGSIDDLDPQDTEAYTAVFDPAQQTIHFFRDGSVHLTVTSGDMSVSFELDAE
nr:phosphodiester glycosidase family protein [Caldalkalibacillus salinus]